jgi:hypothetical protein
MIASGETRLSSMTMRRMPVLAQSQAVPVVDANGNPVLGVNPDGSITPMLAPASLPPSYYAQSGELASAMDDSSVSNGEAGLSVPAGLAEFYPGGPLDAQRFNGQFFGQFTAYSNYAFGIYTSAAGLSLDDALAGANAVAGLANYPPNFPRGGNSNYPNLLNSNYTNIVNGYGAYASGGVCPSNACGGP